MKKTKKQTRNENSHIGRYMIGVGAVIKHPTENKILITKRQNTAFQDNIWEMMYGRVDQHEELYQGLLREISEELGPIKIKIGPLIRLWHFYRGDKCAETEIHGMTFICQAEDTNIELNEEHGEYKWVSPEKALEYIVTPGIVLDVQTYIKEQQNPIPRVYLSNTDHQLIEKS